MRQGWRFHGSCAVAWCMRWPLPRRWITLRNGCGVTVRVLSHRKRNPAFFWLDAAGLHDLYPCLETWADQIRADLLDVGLRSAVAVGFTRFGSYAAAKAARATITFQSREQERAHIHDVPMDRLNLEPRFRDTLFKLGVRELGAFIQLPPSGIRKRFGVEAEALHQLARGNGWSPLNPLPIFEPVESAIEFDWAERDVGRLLGALAGLLHHLFAELSERHEALEIGSSCPKTRRRHGVERNGFACHADVGPRRNCLRWCGCAWKRLC